MANDTEELISKKTFAYSISYFFIKSDFELTTKRLKCMIPNLLWFIPVGKNEVTYPIKQISGVSIHTRFSIKRFIVGILLSLVGLSYLSSNFIGGFFWGLIGILLTISAFRTFISITNAGGNKVSYFISPNERKEAQDLINNVNNQIATL